MKNQSRKHIKFKISVLFMMLSILLVFSACSSSSVSNGSSAGSSKQDDQKVYHLKLNSAYPDTKETSRFGSGEFAKAIEERSNGRIQVDTFFSNELIPQNEILTGLQNGLVDFGLTSPIFFVDTIPEANIAYLPFWVDKLEDAPRVIRETEIGKLIEEAFEAQGAKVLMHTFSVDYGFGLNKKIESVEDMKGLLMRSAGRPTDIWYKELGISGASIPSAEVYDALQRGVIDGAPVTINQLEKQATGEVIDYFLEPAFLDAVPATLFMSKKSWDQLPRDLQDLVMEVALEMEQKGIEIAAEDRENAKVILEKYGVETIKFSAEEEQKLKESAQVIWDEFAKLNENTKKIAEILRQEQNK